MTDDGDIRARRRRGAALAAVLTLSLVTVVGVAVRDRGNRRAATRNPSPSAPALAERRTELPPRLDPEATTTKPLSGNPIRRARLLLQRYAGLHREQPVYALAEDGMWRRIDVARILPVTDRDGNPQPALDVGSLSADGRRAAFAQRDEVLIVDLASAGVRRVPVPGFNEEVLWLGDRVVVHQENRTYLIAADGRPAEVPGPGRDVVVIETGTGAEMIRLSIDAEHRPVLRPSTAAGPGADRRVDGVGNLVTWEGPGWQRGRAIARAALVATGAVERPTAPPTYRLVLVDTASATARFAPDTGTLPLDGAQLLGWYDANTLLMCVEMRRVAVYDLTTGKPAQVTTIAGERSWLSVGR